MKRQDIAVVYVKAHDLSDQGKAYLLQNDFLRWTEVGRVDTGRVEVETVLQQLRDCPGQCKLLVLDCGHMSSDPRLGLLVNEFPRLVERDVRAVNDPNLWEDSSRLVPC